MIVLQKDCINCGKTFRGRADKRYCCGTCRSKYNNRRANITKTSIRLINFRLRKNRRILRKLFLNTKQKTPPTKAGLAANGFMFNYFTHHNLDPDGKRIICCYDYGYRVIKGGLVLIVKQNVEVSE